MPSLMYSHNKEDYVDRFLFLTTAYVTLKEYSKNHELSQKQINYLINKEDDFYDLVKNPEQISLWNSTKKELTSRIMRYSSETNIANYEIKEIAEKIKHNPGNYKEIFSGDEHNREKNFLFDCDTIKCTGMFLEEMSNKGLVQKDFANIFKNVDEVNLLFELIGKDKMLNSCLNVIK